MFGAQVTRYGVARRCARHGVTIGTQWHAGIALVYHYITLYCGSGLEKFLKKTSEKDSLLPPTCVSSPGSCLLIGDSANDASVGLVGIVGRANSGTKLVQAKTVHR